MKHTRTNDAPHSGRALRIGALVLARLILTGALALAFAFEGNPFAAWYTQKKLEAHFAAYHPGESWGVGKAWRGPDGAGAQRYICEVRRAGSEDDWFLAYFADGAALTTRRASVESGYHTYERLVENMCAQADMAGVAAAMEAAPQLAPEWSLNADYAAAGRALFDPAAPVFAVDDMDGPALPRILWLDEYRQPRAAMDDAAAARQLCALKEAAEGCGVPFDYYGVRVTFEYVREDAAYYAAYLPAGQITDEAAVAALLGEMHPVCGEEGLHAMMAFFAAPQAAEANAMRAFAPCGH